uniref:hypothetical protein n=1 Tax=Bacteroides nordii TaxID=291645 RepID=UPI002A9161FE|nr:hypothetical protein [Bacteroides nordii]
MKKNRKRILIIIASIFAGCALTIIVIIGHELYEIQADAEQAFTKQKSYFRQSSFSGKIIKRYPYQLMIKYDSTAILPPLGHLLFYDYYHFETANNTININVPESIYKITELNDSVIKEKGSDSLRINQHTYRLLSAKRLEWLPRGK